MSSDPPLPSTSPPLEDDERAPDPGRRRALQALGATVVGAAVLAPLAMSTRSLVPNVLYEPPRRVKVGPPGGLSDGATFLSAQRVYLFREAGKLYCLSAVCTHLGCTVQQVRAGAAFEFHCPCHGSRYRADGTNFAGPAPKPLAYHPLEIAADDGQVVIDLARTADKAWRLKT